MMPRFRRCRRSSIIKSPKSKVEGPKSSFRLWTLDFGPWTRSPREVREGLVRFGHFDRVLALGHRFPPAPISRHQLIRQPQEHGLAGLPARRLNDPADRQALLAS